MPSKGASMKRFIGLLCISFACVLTSGCETDCTQSLGDCEDSCVKKNATACTKLDVIGLEKCIKGRDIGICHRFCIAGIPNSSVYCKQLSTLCSDPNNKEQADCTGYTP